MYKLIGKRSSLIPFLLFFHLVSLAQTVQFSGTVSDSLNGEPLIGASLLISGDENTGTVTDVKGFYSIALKPGSYQVKVSYVGYKTLEFSLSLTESQKRNIRLQTLAITTGEVVVSGKKGDENIKKVEMSRVQLSGKTLKSLPVLFGETDVLKSITLMPGIKSGGEGNTGIYVRGGGPDQNLILLDDGVIYNAAHLLGFFSVFNGDAVQDVEVVKGGMPAEYGGRLSSIVNVSTRDGDFQKHRYSGGIGLISSRFSAEGPIRTEKSSFSISGRRTYLDAVARPFLPDSLKGNNLFFYDLNAKLSFRLNEKSKLTLTGYFGRDVFKYSPPGREDFSFGVNWGNALFSALYSREINRKWSYRASLSYNDFILSSTVNFDRILIRVSSGLKDWTAKTTFRYTPGVRSTWKFGGQYIFHTFQPGVLNAETNGSPDVSAKINNQYAHEGAVFVSWDYDFSTRLSMNSGLRYSFFNQVGPYDKVLYENNGVRTDQIIQYRRGESIAFWDGLEPRLSLRYSFDDRQSVKASYTRTYQYLHLATSSAATLPNDLWVPSSSLIRPQLADQAAIGYFRNFKKNTWETSVEVYYKKMYNQIEFKPGAQLFFNQNLEGEMIFGEGLSYGAEFFFKRNIVKTTGWVGYTWSRTTRQFDQLNNGVPFFYRYDRRHDISLVVTHQLSAKWEFNFVFVYGTGNVITMPVGRFAFNFGLDPSTLQPSITILDRYTSANTFRMPAYHRADISATWTPSAGKNKRFISSWNFSIYNLYNRKNPYFIYLDADQVNRRVTAKMVYLFPILPSVTWNFKF